MDHEDTHHGLESIKERIEPHQHSPEHHDRLTFHTPQKTTQHPDADFADRV